MSTQDQSMLQPSGQPGPVGEIRSTGMCFVLTIVTLGIYTFVWYYKTHEELKRHTGTGIGGVVALLLALFVGIAMPFLTAHEVGKMYERRGQEAPVSAITGLWVLIPLVGVIIWFVKTNSALYSYWEPLGAS